MEDNHGLFDLEWDTVWLQGCPIFVNSLMVMIENIGRHIASLKDCDKRQTGGLLLTHAKLGE